MFDAHHASRTTQSSLKGSDVLYLLDLKQVFSYIIPIAPPHSSVVEQLTFNQLIQVRFLVGGLDEGHNILTNSSL